MCVSLAHLSYPIPSHPPTVRPQTSFFLPAFLLPHPPRRLLLSLLLTLSPSIRLYYRTFERCRTIGPFGCSPPSQLLVSLIL